MKSGLTTAQFFHRYIMKTVFVQKIVDGKPKGRKRKLQIVQDEIVFDLMDKSSSLLDFPEDSILSVQLNNEILDETTSLNDIDEFSIFMISEEKEEESKEEAPDSGCKLTRTFFLYLQQKGIEKKVEVPLGSIIYDVKEVARQVFTMNQEYCVTIADYKKEVLPSGKKIIDIPDFSTLTLLEKDPQKLDENVTLSLTEDTSPQRQWSEKEVEELLVLKQKVTHSYVPNIFFSKYLRF